MIHFHIRHLPKGNWQFKEPEDVTLVTVHSLKVETPVEPTAAVTPEEHTTPEPEK